MTLHRLPAGALVVIGEDVDLVRYAVRVAQRARARNALPPLRALDRLAAACTVSPPGQTDTPADDVGNDELMDITTAATLLGCSTRQARRLAPQLGGRRVGGRWLLDAQAVAEHHDGTRTA